MNKTYLNLKICIAVAMTLTGFSSAGFADSTREIVTEMNTSEVTTLDQIFLTCTPGIAPNSHNYPTPSSLSIGYLSSLIQDTNVDQIYTVPNLQTGDHCSEIMNLVKQALPTSLSLIRTVKEVTHLSMGRCIVTDVETVTGQLGPYEFEGSQSFNVSPIPAIFCKP